MPGIILSSIVFSALGFAVLPAQPAHSSMHPGGHFLQEASARSVHDVASGASEFPVVQTWKSSLEHGRLGQLEGKWDTETTMMMPGMAPMESRGISTNRWILGGRFMECRQQEDDDSPVSSLVLLGFDERDGKKRYFATGFDSMATHSVVSHGSYDEDKDAIILSGKEHDPGSGGEVSFRQVLEFHGEHQFNLRIYFDLPQVGEQELARIEYRKQVIPERAGSSSSIPDQQAIERMSREELLETLKRIAQVRQEPGLDPENTRKLRELFLLILQRIKETSLTTDEFGDDRAATPLPSGDLPSLDSINTMDREQVRMALRQVADVLGSEGIDNATRVQGRLVFDALIRRMRSEGRAPAPAE
ncbi:MAG: DUF1579 domain-containing protein [Phycisphaerales bacterium]|nr:DUF1579 domain-containing protein [Phycisphaerales bacterium]